MTAEAVAEQPGDDWQRLSVWSIPHFVLSRIAKYTQALIFGVPAGFGVSRTDMAELVWQVPLVVGIALSIWSVLQFVFTRYRVTAQAVEMQRGALFRRRINLAFERIQNVNIVEPFYFRPPGLAIVSIDSAGSSNDEVEIPALSVGAAEELRTYISAMRARSAGDHAVAASMTIESVADVSQTASDESAGEQFFQRSLRDLVIHGLTNNRAFIAVAGILGVFWQTGLSTTNIADALGINFDVIIAGLSLVRFAILLVVALIVSIGVLALLSVLVSIFSFYGFTMYRSGARLVVKRGLINKHEIAVRKSRIQSIRLSQDWLDYLLDRRNIYLEQLTHAARGAQPHMSKHVIVPSVKLSETRIVTDEVWTLDFVEQLPFTPLHWRWFKKWALINSMINAFVLIMIAFVWQLPAGFTAAGIAAWPVVMALVYMSWKRGGLAVVRDMVVVRSGTIGINYRFFPTSKLQDVTHMQTPFMRRRNVSTIEFMTAASKVKAPYLPSDFAREVINFTLADVESRPRSWM